MGARRKGKIRLGEQGVGVNQILERSQDASYSRNQNARAIFCAQPGTLGGRAPAQTQRVRKGTRRGWPCCPLGWQPLAAEGPRVRSESAGWEQLHLPALAVQPRPQAPGFPLIGRGTGYAALIGQRLGGAPPPEAPRGAHSAGLVAPPPTPHPERSPPESQARGRKVPSRVGPGNAGPRCSPGSAPRQRGGGREGACRG